MLQYLQPNNKIKFKGTEENFWNKITNIPTNQNDKKFVLKKIWKQAEAGAELCQAQGKLSLVGLRLDLWFLLLTNFGCIWLILILVLWFCGFGRFGLEA